MSEKKTELNDASKKETCPSSCENKNEEIKQSIPEENDKLNSEKKEKKPINSSDNVSLSFGASELSMLNNFRSNETSDNNMIYFKDDKEKNQTNIHLNINECNEKCDTKKKNENDNISNSKIIASRSKKREENEITLDYNTNSLNKVKKNKKERNINNIINNEKLENVSKAINFSGKKRERENLILNSNNNLLQNYFHSITQIINQKSEGKKIKLHEDINFANLNSKINYVQHDLYCEFRNSTSIINGLGVVQKKLENNNFKNFESNEFNDEKQKNSLENNNYVNSSESNDLKTEINWENSIVVNFGFNESEENNLFLNKKNETNWENEDFALYLENQENTEENNQIETTCFETAEIDQF